MSLIAGQCQEWRETAELLVPLAETLLLPAGRRAASFAPHLRHEPLRTSHWVEPWVSLLAHGGDRVRDLTEALLVPVAESRLLRSEAGWLRPRAYHSIERWLRRHTWTAEFRSPKITLSLSWYVAAAHNWLWWHREWPREWEVKLKADPAIEEQAEKDPEEAARRREESCWAWLEEQLVRDVDSLLVQLRAAGPGDLIAMHIMGSNLRRLVKPAGPARVQIEQANERGGVPILIVHADEGFPEPLAKRLETLAVISPVSRFALAGSPQLSAVEREQPTWRWARQWVCGRELTSVRQYLCSQMSDRLADLRTPPEAVADMLSALEWLRKALQAEGAADAEAAPADEWNAMLGQVLWGTLANVTASTAPEMWSRWSEGYPQRIALAQWCGRLACWAETLAQCREPHHLPGWVWLWQDLARLTLYRWLTGGDRAALCVGLWLHGYFAACPETPPLLLGRRVTGQSLEQVVRHWLSALRIGIREPVPAPATGEPEQEQDPLARLCADLEAIPAYAGLAAALVEADSMAMAVARLETSSSEASDELTTMPPTARIYRAEEISKRSRGDAGRGEKGGTRT